MELELPFDENKANRDYLELRKNEFLDDPIGMHLIGDTLEIDGVKRDKHK